MISPAVARGLRVAALVVALLGVAWDACAAWWLVVPGPSGEWAVLAVPAAWLVGVPCGLIALLNLAIAGRGPTRLRAPVLIASIVAIGTPVLMSVALHRRWL